MPDESGGFKGLLIGFIIFGLFGFLVLTAVSDLASEYDQDTTDLEETFDLDSYQAYLEDAEGEAVKRQKEYTKSNPFSALVEVVVSGIWFVSLGFLTLIWTPFDMLGGVLRLIIGDSVLADVVVGTLFSVLVITIIFGIWRVLKAGD